MQWPNFGVAYNLIGAIITQNNSATPINVVTVFSDSNKKYLTTDLMKEEPVKEGFITPEIELLTFQGIHRM